MRDPYTVLGVTKSASDDDIKQAYRRLAKKLHPDLNPGRGDIEQQFKEVSAAYDLLSDPERRSQYDSGLIGPDGSPKAHDFGRGFGGFDFRTGQAGGSGHGARRAAEADDVFDQIFGMFGQGARRGPFGGTAGSHGGGPGGGPGSGPGAGYNAGTGAGPGSGRTWSGAGGFSDKPEKPVPQKVQAEVPFETAIKGGTHRVTLPSGRALDVRIPVGTLDGAQLRLPEQGRTGPDGTRGDVLVIVAVVPAPPLERDGRNIVCTVDISLDQAVLGGRITVPTIEGPVTMKVPAGSNSGTRLRLRGRGVPAHANKPAGDQYVTLRLKLDDPADGELIRFLLARRDATAAASDSD